MIDMMLSRCPGNVEKKIKKGNATKIVKREY